MHSGPGRVEEPDADKLQNAGKGWVEHKFSEADEELTIHQETQVSTVL